MPLADIGFNDLIELFLNLDDHVKKWAAIMGPWLYVLVFVIVFCETGLVVTPFLPGDSLLFALGAVAAMPDSPINVWLVMLLLIIAAVIGDAVNYAIGAYVGPRVFKREDSWLLNKKHLLYAQDFYERWGSATIVLCRFVPIVRTFGPFVAGIGKMRYPKFALYNVTGAIVWVVGFTLAGYWTGSWPWVQENFSVIILAIVIISVMPMVFGVFFEWRRNRQLAMVSNTPGNDSQRIE
jgi:membrane-associated protein